MNNKIILNEAGEIRKVFSAKEAKQIIEGKLDVTKFFKNKEDSTNRLNYALKGRPVYIGKKEIDDILQRAINFREEVKAFRLKYKIEDPPEYA